MSKTIEFTNKQFKTLTRMIFYGEWISNAAKLEEARDEEDQEAEKLKQYILSKRREFELSEWVDESFEDDLELKEEIILKLLDKITEFEESVFWENLLNKLVEKEMIKRYGIIKYKNMDYSEIIDREEEYRKIYSNAFDKRGINALKLVK